MYSLERNPNRCFSYFYTDNMGKLAEVDEAIHSYIVTKILKNWKPSSQHFNKAHLKSIFLYFLYMQSELEFCRELYDQLRKVTILVHSRLQYLEKGNMELPVEKHEKPKTTVEYPNKGKPWKNHDNDMLSQLTNEGLTIKEISKRMGRSPYGIELQIGKLMNTTSTINVPNGEQAAKCDKKYQHMQNKMKGPRDQNVSKNTVPETVNTEFADLED